MHRLRLPATVDSLPIISAFVWAAAYEANLDRHKAYRLRLAVDELVTNIIGYAYKDPHSPEADVYLEVTFLPHSLEITIKDHGAPYDPTAKANKPDLSVPPLQREIGGLGIYLAMNSVDEFFYTYENDTNVNHVIVYTEDYSNNGG